jgi:tetratricopeptide (TPR) repeat protein
MGTIRLLGAALGALVLLGASSAVADPLPRDPDSMELREMQAKTPHAAELLEKGEALVAAGQTQEAEALFRQAHTEFPDGSILWRKDCEALTALGRRKDAILACGTAVGQAHWGPNVRALVSAFVDGPTPPTAGELSQAVLLTAAERHKGPSFTVAAAACDIAERIGDDVMLQRCAEELRRYNPDDPATKKAFSILASRCPPWRFWGGWGVIAAAVILTLGDAIRRLARRRWPRAGVAAAAATAMGLCSLPGTAAADEPKPGFHGLSKWPVDDEHPDSNIPTEKDRNADPLQFGYWLQDVALKAEHAAKSRNHTAAARFYEVLGKAVPERATGFVKACEEYEAAGDLPRAVDMCADALLRDGLVVKDYTRFVHLVIKLPGPVSEQHKAAIANVLAHMREDRSSQPFVDSLECEVGTRTSNVAQLKECTANLAAKDPNDRKTIVYLWALAIADGKPGQAERFLERAKEAGVAPDDLENMKKATAARSREVLLRTSLVVAAVLLFAAGIAVAIRAILARKRSLPPPGPPPAPEETTATANEPATEIV